MRITITTESRKQIENVQKAFKKHLSEKVILKMTAHAINDTLRNAISNKQMGIKTNIKKEYNLQSDKYLGKAFYVNPKATPTKLFGGIKLSARPIPLIEFKPEYDVNNGVSVQIKRGKTVNFRNSFITEMAHGNKHVFQRGRYVGTKFVSATKLPSTIGEGGRKAKPNEPLRKQRGLHNPKSKFYKTGVNRTGSPYILDAVTSIKTTSPYLMGISPVVGKKINNFMAAEVVKLTRNKLQQSVEQFVKQGNTLRERHAKYGNTWTRG